MGGSPQLSACLGAKTCPPPPISFQVVPSGGSSSACHRGRNGVWGLRVELAVVLASCGDSQHVPLLLPARRPPVCPTSCNQCQHSAVPFLLLQLIEDLRKQLEHLQLFKLECEQRRGRRAAAPRARTSSLETELISAARDSEKEAEKRFLAPWMLRLMICPFSSSFCSFRLLLSCSQQPRVRCCVVPPSTAVPPCCTAGKGRGFAGHWEQHTFS